MTRPRQGSRKQEQIVEAARTLFWRHGVKRVTVEEIAREAGASRVTFYKCFANKRALVQHILREMTETIHRRTEEVRRMDLPFADKVRMLVDDKLRLAKKTSPAFIEEFFTTDDAEIAALVHELNETSARRFLDFVADGQAQGHIRAEIRPAFVLALLERLNEMVADAALRQQYPSHVDLTREVVDFFFYGLLTRSP